MESLAESIGHEREKTIVALCGNESQIGQFWTSVSPVLVKASATVKVLQTASLWP